MGLNLDWKKEEPDEIEQRIGVGWATPDSWMLCCICLQVHWFIIKTKWCNQYWQGKQWRQQCFSWGRDIGGQSERWRDPAQSCSRASDGIQPASSRNPVLALAESFQGLCSPLHPSSEGNVVWLLGIACFATACMPSVGEACNHAIATQFSHQEKIYVLFGKHAFFENTFPWHTV